MQKSGNPCTPPQIFVVWENTYLPITWLWLMPATWKCLSLYICQLYGFCCCYYWYFSQSSWNYTILKKKTQQNPTGFHCWAAVKIQQNMEVCKFLLVNKGSFEMLNPCTHRSGTGDSCILSLPCHLHPTSTLAGIWCYNVDLNPSFLLLKTRSTRGKMILLQF